jgi:mRNA-degrading endonuclease RelE of RelBE toxin-antitoxin system
MTRLISLSFCGHGRLASVPKHVLQQALSLGMLGNKWHASRVLHSPGGGVVWSGVTAIGASVERKILWLAENAAAVIHRRLVGMPDELAGLCKLRVGDWRILDWVYPAQSLIRIYRIQNRSEVYRDF